MTTALAAGPVDAADRLAIRAELDANLVVDAGAGTGKTSELVARIVTLLRSGRAQVAGLAAITFTEAAAAELRHRVRDRLEALAAEGDDPDGRVAAALAGMDDAAFTTLHAFAQRLLADHPLEAGLPPRLEVLAEPDEAAAFEDRWGRFVGALLEDADAAPLVRRGFDLGLRLSALRDAAAALQDQPDRLPALSAPPQPPAPDPDLAPVVPIWAHREGAAPAAPRTATPGLPAADPVRVRVALAEALALRGSCSDPQDGLALHLDGAVAALAQALDDARGDDAVVRALAAAQPLTTNLGTARWWQGQKPAVVAALRTAERERTALLTVQRDAVARALAARLAAFTHDWAAERLAEGRLRFHDLLVRARDLLATRPDVRAALRRRWTHLLVDEFQDTDPLQIELAVLLASPEPLAAGGWADAPLDPGRLFVVGDPLQSIYRFRGADVAVYERARSALPVGVRSLTQNFRCVPGVIAWVNAAFAALVGEGGDGRPAFRPLAAQRGPLAGGPAVRHFGGPAAVPSAEVRAAEARDVAVVVRTVLAEGWPVTDRRTGEVRPARLGDVAVLVRRHRTVRLLERTLEDADLPYRIESKSLVWATDEVRDLVTVLQALDDPDDEVAVVAVLRQAAFACDDRALLDWRVAGGGWRYLAAVPEESAAHPVAAAFVRLRELHAQRDRFSVGGLVEHLIGALRLEELALAHRRPRDRWRRLRFLADQAHAFADGGGDLRGFLRWAAEQAARDVRVDEHLADTDADDAVRISTLHGAKGLEYPVVVLLGLDVDLGKLPAHPRVLWDGDRAELHLGGDLKTAGFPDRRRAEVGLHAAEEARLAYVGATRARDHLVVSLHHRASTPCHAAQLLDLPALDPLWSPLSPAEIRSSGPKLFASPTPNARAEDAVAAFRQWQEGRAARLADAHRPRVLAATAIATALAAPAGVPERHDPGAADTAAGDGAAVGRAVHGVLEVVELDAGEEDVAVLARALAAREGVPGRAGVVAALVRSCLAAPVVRAAASGRHWREVHVGAPLGATAVEGFVDLLVEDAGGLTVVDYKSDALAGRSPAEAVARYHPQMATYALALAHTTGRRVTRCVFVLAGLPHATEVAVEGDALAAAMAEVTAHLGTPSASA